MTTVLDGYRLSPQQARLRAVRASAPELALGAACALLLRGRLDRHALAEAFARVARRHDILRTRIRTATADGAPVQSVAAPAPALEYRDLQGLPEEERATLTAGAWTAAAGRDDDVPLRAILFRAGNDEHVLQLFLSPVCGDAATLDLLITEIGTAYAELTGAGASERTADEPVQYAEYSEGLHAARASGDAVEGRAFWTSQQPAKDAPHAGSEPGLGGCTAAAEHRWDDGFARRLEEAAAAHGTRAEAWLLAAWRVLLQHHVDRAEFVVRAGSDGRVRDEMRSGMGPFIRYLPIPGNTARGVPFSALALATAEALRQARAWQAFYEPPAASGHGGPYPRFGFDFAELPAQAGRWGGVEWRVERRWHQVEPFGLGLSAERVREGADAGLRLALVHDGSARHAEAAPRLLRGLAVLLEATLAPPRPAPDVAPARDARPAPLSFAQERLWFLDQMQPGNPVYNVLSAHRLSGPLDAAAMERALGQVVRRHDALRTTFPAVDGTPVQEAAPFTGFRLAVEDAAGLDDDALMLRAADEAARPFDLAAGPLFRATLLRIADDDHLLLTAMHHIVSDGWSMRVLFRELVAHYTADRQGTGAGLPALPLQYADFARWQRAQLQGPALDRQLAFWRLRLAGAPELLALPADRSRPPTPSLRGASVTLQVPRRVVERLQALATAERASLHMVLLAAFQVLLARYTGSDDVVVGSPIAGRTRLEVEGLIGFFVNMLVMRTDLAGARHFRDVLRRVRADTVGAYEHQDLPFERLVAELQPERSLSHSPLFQVTFSTDTFEAVSMEALPGLRVASVDPELSVAKFDLALALSAGPRGLGGMLAYSTDLFDRATMERMARHVERVLEQVADDPDGRLSGLELMAQAECARVLAWSAGAGESFPVTDTLHGRFQARAAAHPGATAVEGEDGTLSYGGLNARANRLARRLRAAGVGPESRVGLCATRDAGLVTGILAILKAGGAYVPLDPGHPPERLGWMARDAGIRVLLVSPSLRDRVPVEGVEVVPLEDDPAGGEAGDLGVGVAPENLAYVIYTSGSTGRPRGVEVTHANVLRLFDATDARFGFGPDDAWTLFHSAAFDFSVWEAWGALLYGGRLVVVPWALTRDPDAFRALLADARVTVLSQTPSAFAALALADERAGAPLEHLRTVVFGGEALRYEALAGWLDRYGPERPRLVNLYGITETTVHVTHHTLTGAEPDEPRVGSGVGTPIADLSTYVLDPEGKPVPVGIPGELYVGGAGLARGYGGQPGRTAASFVPDPFSAVAGARLYRSGDQARWRADGTLEYLGRMDLQVKIRGFRIEPGEVQAALRAHPGVEDVVVADYEHAPGDRRLAAYVVPHARPAGPAAADARVDGVNADGGAGEGTSAAGLVKELRVFARERLPEYMVPAAFVLIGRVPLTANGKMDRRALPAPVEGAAHAPSAPPREGLEAQVAAIWCEVLGVERVGREDGFFDIGGHSLLLARVHARLREALGREIAIVELFRHTTVAALAEHLGAVAEEVAPTEGLDRAALRRSRSGPRRGGADRRSHP
ncbi:MAG TPA: amino acid adenylation domain-containing protein [Longimicrobium sp.]|nr:amino acid adenylation domain-containing protein [Longimicrobium sp.]